MARKKSSAVEKSDDESEFEPVILSGDKKEPVKPPGFRPGRVPPVAPHTFEGMRHKKIEGEELLQLGSLVQKDSVEQKILDAVIPNWNAVNELGVDEKTFVEELMKFLNGNFSRHAERNPPPVPKRKFVPRKDQIIPFLDEVWGEWIAASQLTKPLLKEHDDKAYDALMNYQRNKPLPTGLELATQKEANDLFLERGYFTADEAHRVVGLLSRRKNNNDKR